MAAELLRFSLLPRQNRIQIALKTLQDGNPFCCCLQNLTLVNEHLPAITLHQRTQAFAHAPADIAEDLHTLRPRHQEGDAVVTKDSDRLGKAIKGLQLEAGYVELLELFGGVHEEAISK